MTNAPRTPRSTLAARIVGSAAAFALGAGLLPVLATPASATVLVAGDGKSHIQAQRPWKENRGTLWSTIGTTLAGLASPLAASVGTDVFSDIPKITGDDGEKFRGAYAWVSCPFNTASKAIDATCKALQGKPDGAVKIDGGKVVPTGNMWVTQDAQGALFGKTNTLTVPSEAVATWLTLAWTAQVLDQNGTPTGRVYNGQSPESILVMPRNPEAVGAPQFQERLVAGGAFVAAGADWPQMPNGTRSGAMTAAVWVCTKEAAATDTSITWDVANGCTRLTPETAPNEYRRPVIRGTVPANSAGKFLVINATYTALPTASTTMPGSFTWQARSNALSIAAPAAAPEAGAAAPGAGGAAAAPAAGAGAAAGGAPAAAGGASDAATARGANSADIAAGAGVNLEVAPIVGADGRGTGASAKLKMGLAASKKVNRGRYITVVAALTPKASTGKVRIVLARTNAKGKVIASKALFATMSKGKATKRWQIPRAYAAGNYTVVATYVPSKKGAPGVTAVAPVQIG